MKKIICVMACVSIMLVLAACGSQTTASVQSTQPQTKGRPESATSTETASTTAETAFEQYEAALNEKGIFFEKVQMAAEMVGAAEGAKYKIDGGAVELYIFDTDEEAYKTAADKQALTMKGFGDFPATVENGMALIVSDLESEEYLEIFRSLKVTE